MMNSKNIAILWILSLSCIFCVGYYRANSQSSLSVYQINTQSKQQVRQINPEANSATQKPYHASQKLSIDSYLSQLQDLGAMDDYYGTLGLLNELSKSISFMTEPEVIAALENIKGEKHWRNNGIRNLLYKRWVELNPVVALTHALNTPAEYNMLFYRNFANWMKLNPAEAYQWYKSNEKQASEQMSAEGGDIFTLLTCYDLNLAMNELSNPSLTNKDKAFKNMSSLINSRADFEKLLALGTQLEISDSQINQFIKNWATRNPTESMDWVLSQPIESVDKSLATLIGPWLKNDPMSTMDWIKTYRGDNAHTYNEILNQMQGWSVEPNTVIDWLKKESPSLEREAAFANLARKRANDPQVVKNALEQIESEEIRIKTLSTILPSLLNNKSPLVDELLNTWSRSLIGR